LLRITGEAVSAGIGSDYLKTNRLIGCLLSAKAVGDISSEKAYLDGVLMTCALDKHRAIEIPVKAYITSNAKSGIREEVVSREGDMVLKAFLSGIAGGVGNGVSQMSQPQM
jgi:conjugal transfer pilus assembly protein TraB